MTDLVGMLIARKWTILAIALVVTAASVFSASQQRTTYTSRASVIVTGAAQTSIEAQQLMATGKKLARSRAVALIVARDLPTADSAEQLLDGLSVTIPLNTQLIEFEYAAETPQEAIRLVQAFADAYRTYQSVLLDGLVASSRAIDQLTDALRARLVAVQATAATATDPIEVSSARTEIVSLTDRIRGVEQERTMLLTSAPMVSTLAESASPAVENAPPVKRGAAVGLVAGAVLGAFVAFALESHRLRRRRRSAAAPLATAIWSENGRAWEGERPEVETVL